MTFTRARALPLVGAGCLVGQGILLALAAASTPGPEAGILPARGLFLALTLLLAVTLAFCPLDSRRSLSRRLWRALTLVGVSVPSGRGRVGAGGWRR